MAQRPNIQNVLSDQAEVRVARRAARVEQLANETEAQRTERLQQERQRIEQSVESMFSTTPPRSDPT